MVSVAGRRRLLSSLDVSRHRMNSPPAQDLDVRLSSSKAARARWGILPVLMAALACSSFDGGSDVASTPSEPSESTATAPLSPAAPGQDWSCLGEAGEVLGRPLGAVQAERIVYSVQLVDLATQQPRAGVQARACGLTDVECANPVAGPVTTDEQGWLDIPLFAGFTGYLEIQGADLLPGLLHFGSPLTLAQLPRVPYFVLSFDSLAALGRVLGVEVNPMQGLISAQVFDCQGLVAPGAVLSQTGSGVGWYFQGGLPSITARATGPEGIGGFANVPSGVTRLDVSTTDGVAIAATQSLVIRPRWSSALFVFPDSVR